MIRNLGLRSTLLRATPARSFKTLSYTLNAGVSKLKTTEDYITVDKANDELLGGYPDVKTGLFFNRDPYRKYDDQQNRRNFHEPLDPEDDMKNMWSPDYYQTVSDKNALITNGFFFGGIAAFAATLYLFFYPEKPAVPRNYPHGGLAKSLGATNDEEAKYLAARIDRS